MNLGTGGIFGLLPAIGALDLEPVHLYPEVALIAYHFHWSRAECMSMSRSERRQWINEIGKINREIAENMKPKGKG